MVPGPNGHWSYIIQIKDRLKTEGFRFNGERKIWYRLPDGAGALPKGIAAFNLGGVVAKEVQPKSVGLVRLSMSTSGGGGVKC